MVGARGFEPPTFCSQTRPRTVAPAWLHWLSVGFNGRDERHENRRNLPTPFCLRDSLAIQHHYIKNFAEIFIYPLAVCPHILL